MDGRAASRRGRGGGCSGSGRGPGRPPPRDGVLRRAGAGGCEGFRATLAALERAEAAGPPALAAAVEAARPDLSRAFLNWMAEEAADGLALEVLRLADRGQPLPAPPAGPAAGGDGLGLVRASPFFSLSAEGLDRQAAALDLMARETRAAKETSYRRLVGLHQVEFDAYREAVGSMEAAWRIIDFVLCLEAPEARRGALGEATTPPDADDAAAVEGSEALFATPVVLLQEVRRQIRMHNDPLPADFGASQLLPEGSSALDRAVRLERLEHLEEVLFEMVGAHESTRETQC